MKKKKKKITVITVITVYFFSPKSAGTCHKVLGILHVVWDSERSRVR